MSFGVSDERPCIPGLVDFVRGSLPTSSDLCFFVNKPGHWACLYNASEVNAGALVFPHVSFWTPILRNLRTKLKDLIVGQEERNRMKLPNP